MTFITGKEDIDSDDEDEDSEDNVSQFEGEDDASEDPDDVADDDNDLQDLSDIDLADVDDEDLSDMEFNDSEDEEGVDDELISSLNKKLNAKGPKNKKKEVDNKIFVSAEKFAEMLEEQNKTKGKHGGSNVFSSSDGAGAKQIDWEMKRHQRMKGPFGKKRKSVQASNNNRVKRYKR